MKNKKAQNWKTDDCSNNRDDYDDCCLANVFTRFLNEKNDHIYDEKAHVDEDHSNEGHKIAIISLSNTCTNNTAVMVKYLNTILAC